MLVRFRYSGRSSVSHYCLTRLVSLTCVPSAMSIGLVKDFEPLKSREQQLCGFYGARGCRATFIGREFLPRSLFLTPLDQRQVAAWAKAEGAACI